MQLLNAYEKCPSMNANRNTKLDRNSWLLSDVNCFKYNPAAVGGFFFSLFPQNGALLKALISSWNVVALKKIAFSLIHSVMVYNKPFPFSSPFVIISGEKDTPKQNKVQTHHPGKGMQISHIYYSSGAYSLGSTASLFLHDWTLIVEEWK